MAHRLPELPWPAAALAPQMSARTLELHHGKHHAAYVEKLNKLVKGTELAGMALEDLVLQSEGEVFNNAAQHWNHSFFWRCLRPAGGEGPGADLRSALVQHFDSLASFKQQFSAQAVAHFGSGWTWLVGNRRGGLEIVSTSNAGNPLRDGGVPLLACDVWEHAYYVDYENRRPDYLKAYWELVDWTRVSQRHAALAKTATRPAAARGASDRPAR